MGRYYGSMLWVNTAGRYYGSILWVDTMGSILWVDTTGRCYGSMLWVGASIYGFMGVYATVMTSRMYVVTGEHIRVITTATQHALAFAHPFYVSYS
eukprot:40941-Amorphochlora_amoeboformis.AAC.1